MSIDVKIEEQLKIDNYDDAIEFLGLYSSELCLKVIPEEKQKEFLRLRSEDTGWTVAHEMARDGYEFTDPAILQMADRDGYTVAHAMASFGHKSFDPGILGLSDIRGITVANICDNEHNTDQFHKIMKRHKDHYDIVLVGPVQDNEQLFWSNKDGWVDKDSATRFKDLAEMPNNLPEGVGEILYVEKESRKETTTQYVTVKVEIEYDPTQVTLPDVIDQVSYDMNYKMEYEDENIKIIDSELLDMESESESLYMKM